MAVVVFGGGGGGGTSSSLSSASSLRGSKRQHSANEMRNMRNTQHGGQASTLAVSVAPYVASVHQIRLRGRCRCPWSTTSRSTSPALRRVLLMGHHHDQLLADSRGTTGGVSYRCSRWTPRNFTTRSLGCGRCGVSICFCLSSFRRILLCQGCEKGAVVRHTHHAVAHLWLVLEKLEASLGTLEVFLHVTYVIREG